VEIDVSVPDYIDFGGWEAGNELNVKYTTRVKSKNIWAKGEEEMGWRRRWQLIEWGIGGNWSGGSREKCVENGK
jgi:hypothetical protein